MAGKNGKGKGKGEDCTYVLGIPIHETDECRSHRKRQRFNHQENQNLINEGAHTDNVDIRNAQQVASDLAGGDTGPTANDYLGTVLTSLGPILGGIGTIANPLSGIFGGGSSTGSSSDPPAPPTTDLTPIALAAGAAVLLLLWSSK